MNVSVIGSINIDVIGVSRVNVVPRDSNPGRISFSMGGVGANIARALAQSGANTRLFTCVCDDFAGSFVTSVCKNAGVDISNALICEGRTSSYVCIHDSDGDLALGVNDMALTEALTPEYIQSVADIFNAGDALVIDANLRSDSLECAARLARVPIIADCVSAHKAHKLLPVMGSLAAIKPNMDEAFALTGEKAPESAAEVLLKMGAKRVIISLGADGCYFADENARGFIRPERVYDTSTNGAGDCMTAGITLAACQNEAAEVCARRGMALSENLLRSGARRKNS